MLQGKRATAIILDDVERMTPKERQTRIESLVEALINIVIGFVINFAGNWFILPLVGFTTLTVRDNFVIGFLFTIISIIRQYTIRRWAQDHLRRFNRAISTRIRKLING